MSKGKYYDSIEDLPILYWNRCVTKNSLEHLVINGKPTKEQLQDAWDNIENEIIEFRLQDPKYIEILEEKKRKALRMIKAIQKNDAALKHRIKVEQELESEEEKDQRVSDMYDVLDYLSRTRGIELDEKTTSVRKYLTYLKNARNGN